MRLLRAAILLAAFPAGALGQGGDARPRVQLGGVGQVQFNTSSIRPGDLGDDAAHVARSTFELRRVRTTVDMELDGWITGRLQPDFGLGRVRLADAWVNLAFAPGAQLRVGQFKKPFSRVDLTSPATSPIIERGLVIRGLDAALLEAAERGLLPAPGVLGTTVIMGEHYQILTGLLYSGRDIGAAFHGRLGVLGFGVGIFNGEGADRRDVNDRQSVAGRVTLGPWRTVPVSLGGGASYRETAGNTHGLALEADAELGSAQASGLRLLLEVAVGENLALADENFIGAYGLVRYRIERQGPRLRAVEPAVRVSYGDPARGRDGDEGWLVTPGLSLVLPAGTRLSLNWDAYLPGAETLSRASAWRAQAQVAF
jgi:hypothetical protein